jgi:LytS/YehU family sensor histidine kinase
MRNKQLEAELIRARLEALKLRMNPHLVANALTSIRSLLFKNETDAAINYLTSLSGLIRTTFENSEKDFISLSAEISYLTRYIEIEKLRFGDKFTFHLVVSPEIKTSEIMVPQMLFQPFVENAMNHGLMHRARGGALKISFESQSGSLTCIIEDNGVGRKKAKEIEMHAITTHTSLSDIITKERIMLLNRLFKNEAFSIQTVDLIDQQMEPAGTRVVIQMPALDIEGWIGVLN